VEHENNSHWCNRHHRGEVVKALALNKHDVVGASRNGDVRVNLDDPATICAMFEKVSFCSATDLDVPTLLTPAAAWICRSESCKASKQN